MSKAVLISIQPKWCEKIANGEKTVEVRKTQPNLKTPLKCYIYCTIGERRNRSTQPAEAVFFGNASEPSNGKVIGEFVCDRILDCRDVPIEPTGLTVEEWLKYTDGYKGPVYGWHISALRIYDTPKELIEFFNPCIKDKYPYCFDCEHGLQKGEQKPLDGLRYFDIACGNRLKSPPQSWCYVEELPGGDVK